MTPVTSCREIIEIAIEMERIAEEFYEALAAGSGDPKVQRFCRRVTAEEARHQAYFRAMCEELPGPDVDAGSRSERLASLVRMARERVQPDPSFVRAVAMGHDPRSALEMAVTMEESAIRFYEGLASALPGAEAMVQRITLEERKHLTAFHSLAGRFLR